MGVEQRPDVSRDRGPDPVTTGLLAIVLGTIWISLVGCSAKVGPDEYGWARWDVCGFEGGVAAELTILAMTARLGCTNPPEAAFVNEAEEPELEATP